MQLNMTEFLMEFNKEVMKEGGKPVKLGDFFLHILSYHQAVSDKEAIKAYDLGMKIGDNLDNESLDFTADDIKLLDKIVCDNARMPLIHKGQILKLLRQN